MEALSLFERPARVSGGTIAPREPAPAVDRGLRPYQREAVSGILAQLAEQRSTLVVLPTGAGKTQTFGDVAADWPGRVLVLAHRDELIDQARARLHAMTGEMVGVEQAGWWAAGERIVVASVQTLVNERRRERFKSAPFALVIVDEAHHATARSYRAILDAFPSAKVLGVTATPDRGDGSALGDIFETVAYERDIETCIDDGYLVPVSVRQVILEQVDLSKVKTTAGDLNVGQLDEEMLKANHAVAERTLDEAGDRLTIVFSTKVETAHDLAATFNKIAGRRVAATVDGKTPDDERRSLLREHAKGGFQFLVNVGIATEGYDCPAVSCVAIARPTKSRALYTQMAGRGLRVLPGLVETIADADGRRGAIASSAKPDCLLLDFAGNAGRHALVHPLDILGGRLADDVLDEAKKLVAERKMGAREAVQAARDSIEAERKRRADAMAAYQAQVRARTIDVDPFQRSGIEGAEPFPTGAPPSMALTNTLIESFKLKAYEIPKTQAEASQLMRTLIGRRKAQLCSFRQAAVLKKHGIPTENLKGAVASQLIDAISANGWRSLPVAQVNAILNPPRSPGEEG
jgi:superfamily II DNA or RNA helicase